MAVSGKKADQRKTAKKTAGSKKEFATLKQAFLDAFEASGGVNEFAKWARKAQNRARFCRMIARMLPKNIESENKAVIVRIENQAKDKKTV